MNKRLHNTHRQKAAFTLIELLTVIAIVAVLATILIPAISRIRERAQGVSNATNLRQVYAAMALWGNEHGNAYMPARAREMLGFGNQYWNWYGTGYSTGNHENGLSPLAGYMGYPMNMPRDGHRELNRITISPFNLRSEPLYERGQEGAYGYPYVANYWVMAHPTTGRELPKVPLLKSSLSEPAKILLLADSSAENAWGLGITGIDANSMNRIGASPDGRTAILWADGHITHVKKSEIREVNIVPQN